MPGLCARGSMLPRPIPKWNPDFKSWREPIPHRWLRLWLREDPALPRPTGDPARKEGFATAHGATILILESPLLPVSFWDGYSEVYFDIATGIQVHGRKGHLMDSVTELISCKNTGGGASLDIFKFYKIVKFFQKSRILIRDFFVFKNYFLHLLH